MPSELEKGMKILEQHIDGPSAPVVSAPHCTGKLRWNGNVLEQEFATMYYERNRPHHEEFTWVPVPQVQVAEPTEAGEHQVVLDAIEAHNTGEE